MELKSIKRADKTKIRSERPAHDIVVPSYVHLPVKRAKQNWEGGCEYDLMAALEHQKKAHLNLMHRALQYRAGVGLYKRKMQQFHESLDEVEKKAFRAVNNLKNPPKPAESYWSKSGKGR